MRLPSSIGSISADSGAVLGPDDDRCRSQPARAARAGARRGTPAAGSVGACRSTCGAVGWGKPVGPVRERRSCPRLSCWGCESLYGPRAEPGLTSRTPEQVSPLQHRGADPRVRRRGRAGRCGGRRRPRRRGRRRAGGRPIASGVCSGRTVSIRPVRTPSAISSTRSSHIARHCPRAQCVARAAAGASGAGTAARRGRRCRRRRAPTGPSAGRRSAPLLRRIRAQARSGSASARSGSGPEPGDDGRRAGRGEQLADRWRRGGRRTTRRRRRRSQPQPHLPDRRGHLG